MMIDGNRRWARQLGYDTAAHGHRAGAAKMREFLEWCDDVGICGRVALPALERQPPQARLAGARRPHRDHRRARRGALARARLARAARGVGAGLPAPTSRACSTRAEQRTADKHGLHVNLAVGYGGRKRDRRRDAQHHRRSTTREGGTLEELAESLTPEQIGEHLYTGGQPDPDLVIRTSGEQRLSDFLLWQARTASSTSSRRSAPTCARSTSCARSATTRRAIAASAAETASRRDARASAMIWLGEGGVRDHRRIHRRVHRGARLPRLGRVRPALDRRRRGDARAHRRCCSAPARQHRRGRRAGRAGARRGIRAHRLRPPTQIVFQPNTTHGLMHAMFGLTGGVLLSPRRVPEPADRGRARRRRRCTPCSPCGSRPTTAR